MRQNSATIKRSSACTTTPDPATLVTALTGALDGVLLGKSRQTRLALACVLAGGHLLIEDLPGMGKTLLGHALAQVLGLRCQRIQFTSDLLPGDIVGSSVFERDAGEFRFVPGPIFNQVVLADEINRATPRTQSALLEAMAEGQVTVEGNTRSLPAPFIVIATQNPASQSGTFDLPESQLDRFLMRIELGYPSPEAERDLLRRGTARPALAALEPVLDGPVLLALQAEVQAVAVGEALLDYLQRLVACTRAGTFCLVGLSPRAVLALLAAARAWAWLEGRAHVIPEDIQAVFPAVVAHRLQARPETDGREPIDLARQLLAQVDVVGAG